MNFYSVIISQKMTRPDFKRKEYSSDANLLIIFSHQASLIVLFYPTSFDEALSLIIVTSFSFILFQRLLHPVKIVCIFCRNFLHNALAIIHLFFPSFSFVVFVLLFLSLRFAFISICRKHELNCLSF